MPRLGLGMPLAAGLSQDVVTAIDDFFFESSTSGEINPMLTTSRTNLALYSEAWDNASWNKNAATVEANQIASPLDLNAFTADLLKEDNTNADHWVRSNNITASLGQTFTMSFYAKAKERTFIKANFLNSGVVSYNVWINLSNGAITSKNSNLTVTTELIGSGFYRITLTAQAAATTLNLLVQLATGDGVHSYAGDGSSGAYVFGAQIEQDNFVSNYIPTVGSTVSVSTTLNDTSEVWDFDSTDIMLEADPEDEGFWEESYPDGATLPELVLNGDYEELGSEIVANGTFDLGSELVTNGAFDTDSDWTLQSSWSISGGKANYDAVGSGHYLKQTISPSISVGKAIKIQFDISDVAAGKTAFLKLEIDGSPEAVFGYTHFSAGTYTYYYKITSALNRLNFVPVTSSTGGVFSIDNVSVKEVVTWTAFGTGINIASGVFTSDGTSDNFDNILAGATTETWDTSEYYEVTFDVPSYTSGNFKLNNSTHNITSAISASGSYKVYFKPSTANTVIGVQNAGTPFKGSIDNISVKQVDPNDRWTLGAGWSIEDGKAISTTAQSNLTSTAALLVGNTYEFTLTSAAVSSGSYSFLLRFNSTNTNIGTVNSDGTHTFRAVADSTSFRLQTLSGGGTSFSIDNVTVKEYAIQPLDI